MTKKIELKHLRVATSSNSTAVDEEGGLIQSRDITTVLQDELNAGARLIAGPMAHPPGVWNIWVDISPVEETG